MNAYGMKLTFPSSASVTPESIEPLGTGRCSSASPCSTLSVASVAMIDGRRTIRIRVALTSPTAMPTPTSARAPRNSVPDPCPSDIVNEATTTHIVISAPTEMSKAPTSNALTCPIAMNARGSAVSSRLFRLYWERKSDERLFA